MNTREHERLELAYGDTDSSLARSLSRLLAFTDAARTVGDMDDTTTTYTAVELLELANTGHADHPITTRTLRYYTSLNLIDPPISRPGQSGRYTPRHLAQLATIRAWRARGRGLAEIAATFANDPDASTAGAPPCEPAPTVTLPAGLPLPASLTSLTTTTTSGTDATAGTLNCWPAPNNARVVTIAPGVQVIITAPATSDHGLVGRLIAAAHQPVTWHPNPPYTPPYTYPVTIWNGN